MQFVVSLKDDPKNGEEDLISLRERIQNLLPASEVQTLNLASVLIVKCPGEIDLDSIRRQIPKADIVEDFEVEPIHPRVVTEEPTSK